MEIEVETIEKFGSETMGSILKDKNQNKSTIDKLKETIARQREEIEELKATIKKQW